MEFRFERRYRGPLKAVLLDWAGTTIDHGCRAPAMAFMKVYEKYGVPISMEEARAPMGVHKREHIRRISRMDAVVTRWVEKHGRPPTDEDVERMFQDFVPMQIEALRDHAELIPGTLEMVTEIRRRGMKVGSTTGYTSEMMEFLTREAAERGYEPDATVCASEVPAGRPEPWMCLESARRLRIYPMEAIVKVGDTRHDIHEGLNAGMWCVGLASTGNEMGLSEKELQALDPEVRDRKLRRAYDRMAMAGAHHIIDSISDLAPCLDDIDARLARGERP